MNLVARKIHNITLQKKVDSKRCAIEIGNLDNATLSVSTHCVDFFDPCGCFIVADYLHWQDMFKDGVQFLIDAEFEDLDSGRIYNTVYDVLSASVIKQEETT